MDLNEFQQYNDILTICPLFSGMDQDQITSLPVIRDGVIVKPASGERISSDYLYIILKGGIRIEKRSSDSRDISMQTSLPGTAVNAASVLSSERDLSLLYAKKGSVLLQADEHAVRSSLEMGGAFSVNYTAFLVDRIHFLNSRIVSFTGYGTESRLVHYLVENEHDGTITLPPLISFAKVLGAGRASLYRALDHLEDEGKIKRDGRTILITGKLQ